MTAGLDSLSKQSKPKRTLSWFVGPLILLAAIMVLVFSSNASAAGTYAISQLTSGGDSQDVQVSGDRVVWSSTGGVFTWAPDTGVMQLVSAGGDDPQVSGDRVVWSTAGGVFTWTPATGTVQLGDHPSAPRVSGDRVAWAERWEDAGYGHFRLITWTAATGTTEILSAFINYEEFPDVVCEQLSLSAGRVAYCLKQSGDRVNWKLGTWTAGTGAQSLGSTMNTPGVLEVSGDRVLWTPYTDNTYEGHSNGYDIVTRTQAAGSEILGSSPDGSASLSGDRVAWSIADGVFTWTPATGKAKIADSYAPAGAVVSGDRVAWSDADGVFTWTPATGKARIADTAAPNGVAVSGDRAAWSTASGVFTWTPATGTVQIADSSSSTVLSSGRVVWLDEGNVFTAVPASSPTITSIYPVRGSVSGGTVVVIKGSGFVGLDGPDGVTFGGSNASSYTVDSPTQITAVAPAHAAGTVGVNVNVVLGSAINAAGALYTYVPAPTIAGLSPATGSTLGGTLVTITGTGLDLTTSVKFDESRATIVSKSATKLTVRAPAHNSSVVHVRVTTTAGTSRLVSADRYGYYLEYQQSDARFLHSAGWLTATGGSYSGGSYEYTKSTGASVTICFTGSNLDWIARVGPGLGTASVSIDGKTPVTVSLNLGSTKYKQKVWSTGLLTRGLHTVKISRKTGTINLDAVRIVGSPAGYSTFQQNHPLLGYAGTSWRTVYDSSASGGSYRRANTLGSKVTISFTGVMAKVLATKASSMGIMKITLDGRPAVNKDLYNRSALRKQVIWTSPLLTPGNHTLRLEWTGLRNDLATASYINLDAIQVIGGLR